MIIYFRKSKALPDPIIINDHTVERVSTYEYLGVMLNNGQATLNTIFPNLIQAIIVWEIKRNFNVDICI